MTEIYLHTHAQYCAHVLALDDCWGAGIGDVLTFLPENFQSDVPLLLFGTAAVVAGTVSVTRKSRANTVLLRITKGLGFTIR